MRKNLIIGGAGFIGTALAECIGESEVTVFDNFASVSHSDYTIKKTAKSDVELFVGDVSRSADVSALFESGCPENIIYLAAETGTGRSLTNCALNARVNVLGLSCVLDAMSAKNIGPKNIILASTRAVYGEGPYADELINEVVYPEQRKNADLSNDQFEFNSLIPLKMDCSIHHPNPCNVYGATKLTQEHLIKIWCRARDIPFSIVRFQNVYGDGQSLTNPYTGILIHFIKQVKKKLPLEVYENGGITRDFVHVKDAALLLACCLKYRPDCGLFDCGSGDRVTLDVVAAVLAEVGGAPVPVKVNNYRLGDVRHACADISNAKNLLQWQPQIDLHDGLSELYDSVVRRLN